MSVNNTILNVDFLVVSSLSKTTSQHLFFCNESSVTEKGPLYLVQSFRLD